MNAFFEPAVSDSRIITPASAALSVFSSELTLATIDPSPVSGVEMKRNPSAADVGPGRPGGELAGPVPAAVAGVGDAADRPRVPPVRQVTHRDEVRAEVAVVAMAGDDGRVRARG
jgi:hypothetical protein